MEKSRNYGYPIVFSAAFLIGIIASAFCIVAEFKKSKERDLKLDGRWCDLPGSKAYGFGLSALICFSTAQIVGNLIVFLGFQSGEMKSWGFPRPKISAALMLLSWLSFVIAIILMATGTSMSRRQRYGKGWLDGECYLVKDGIFTGAAILILLSLACTSALAALTNPINKLQVSTTTSDEKPPKIID